MNLRVGVVGIPLAVVYPKNAAIATIHVAEAANYYRTQGLIEALRQPGIEVIDFGDITLPPLPNDPGHVEDLRPGFDAITTSVKRCIGDCDFLLSLGGSCLTSSGTLPAVLDWYPSAHLLWLDAHPDFTNHKTTPSHFLPGMSLSHLVGYNEIPPVLPGNRVTVLSGRGADWNELTALREYQVNVIGPDQIDGYLPNRLPATDLYLHFDVDTIDIHDMPAVDLPVIPGIPASTILDFVQRIASTGRLCGMELTAFNPTLDPKGVGVSTVRRLLTGVLTTLRDALSVPTS